MSEGQIHTDTETRDYARDFLDGTSPVVDSSEINENFHLIKAIEKDGLPIEIVGINTDVTYQIQAAVNSSRGRVLTVVGDDEKETISDEMFEFDDDTTVFYYANRLIVDVDIYYKTPFNQIYKGRFSQSRKNVPIKHRKATPGFGEDKNSVLDSIIREVDSSSEINSINDISSLNTVSARFHPEKTLEDGQIEVSGDTASFSSCQKVDHSRSGSDDDSIIRFLTSNGIHRYSDDETEYEHDWIWTHISDVKGDTEDYIALEVETPFGKSVFPYRLTHDTETPFWTLVEKAGGSLTSLRGMDVCIRRRGGYHRLYKQKDIRNVGFTNHDHPEFGTRQTEQPINTPSLNGSPLLIDCPTDISPVGVDSEYIWTLGVPPHDRFHHQNNVTSENKKTDSEKQADKSGEKTGILPEITNFL